jgi:Protein of unknown function (DUF2924)
MRSTMKSLARRPKISAAAPHGRTAADSGRDQNDSDATSGPDTAAGIAANALDNANQQTDRVALLPTLGLQDLRVEWRRLFRADPPRLSRDIMMRAIAYRLQEIVHGGPSKGTQRRLVTLTDEFEMDGRIAPLAGPKIKSGSRLVREWHGRTHTVCVTDEGFEFQGRTYRSLTKIARDITGAQWSGPRFFGLTKASATATATPNARLIGAETISENPNG